ncbi:GGDEF domain-containing protein, partial [Brevibacillus sp. SIMBA_076]
MHFYPLNTVIESLLVLLPGLTYIGLGGRIGESVHLIQQGVAMLAFLGMLFFMLTMSFALSYFMVGER